MGEERRPEPGDQEMEGGLPRKCRSHLTQSQDTVRTCDAGNAGLVYPHLLVFRKGVGVGLVFFICFVFFLQMHNLNPWLLTSTYVHILYLVKQRIRHFRKISTGGQSKRSFLVMFSASVS